MALRVKAKAVHVIATGLARAAAIAAAALWRILGAARPGSELLTRQEHDERAGVDNGFGEDTGIVAIGAPGH